MTQITFYLFATKLGIKIKNNIEGHGQRSSKLIEMLSMLRYIFGPNLELPTSIVGEWLHGQAKKRVNFDFQVKFDLEGQDQSTPKTIGILTKMFCMSGSNLVILVRTSDKLSHGQARDWRPHGQTQATTIPEGQNWPRVKNHWFRTWNNEQRQEIINIWNITPNLHTNSHFEMWAEKWTIMQEASGSSTAPNAARRISC